MSTWMIKMVVDGVDKGVVLSCETKPTTCKITLTRLDTPPAVETVLGSKEIVVP